MLFLYYRYEVLECIQVICVVRQDWMVSRNFQKMFSLGGSMFGDLENIFQVNSLGLNFGFLV